MLGVINKKEYLSIAFKKIKGLHEVYVSQDFSLVIENPTFTLLANDNVSYSLAFNAIQTAYTQPVKLYIVTDAYSSLLKDKRIVWREGAWFI